MTRRAPSACWTSQPGGSSSSSSALDDLGTIASCSLFSPMQAFADQTAAEATAADVMTALFEPASDATAPG